MRLFRLKNVYYFIIISLLLHSGTWTAFKFAPLHQNPPPKEKVEIVILDQSQVRKQKETLKQIVEQNKDALNDEIPENAKYLSANNQRVVKETRAQQSGDFRNTAGKGENKPAVTPREQRQASKKSKVAQGTLPTLSDLRPQYTPSTNREINPTNGGGGPASQTNDYLKDAPPSLETLLSTREFVYFTYYQRIRAQIRQFWEPSIRQKVKRIFAQGRTIASEKDHITRVIIVLDRAGSLLRIQVIGESGVKDLDDAAVEAFRAAEPFPNPPKGIVEKDGTIKINWDFVLEASLGNTFDHQRYARARGNSTQH